MLTAKIIKRKDLDLIKWEHFVSKNANSVVYFHSWFLDCVANDWIVIVVEKNNEWIAALPLQIKSKYCIKYSIQPSFVKYLGIVFSSCILLCNDTYSEQKKIQSLIVKTMPSAIQYFEYNFHPKYNYFLPLYWLHFTIRPRFSYRLYIENKNDISYSSSITNHVKKAQKENLVCIRDTDTCSVLQIAINRKILTTEKASIFNNLLLEIEKNNAGFILSVIDLKGEIHASATYAIDGDNAFMILSMLNPKYKSSGGNSLLIVEAIKILQTKNIKYLFFEGSMIENVEAYIRGFRPEPILYYNISKSNSYFYYIIVLIKRYIQRII